MLSLSEVSRSLIYIKDFLENNNELQVLALSYPLDEFDLLFSNLDTVLSTIKKKTGSTFVPVVL